jgi:hypothetical protein
MIYRVEYLKDVVGNNYLGINIWKDAVHPYLEQMEEILGDDFPVYSGYQQDRDRGHYHITVINVMEYNRISSEMGIDSFVNSLESVFDFEFDDLKFMGIGTAERSGNRAYFVVVRSEKLQAVRKRYGLTEQDFHITLGFKHKDVFGVRKNEVITINDPFIKLLKKKYYNETESFGFLREIENFDFDLDKEIYPVKIEDSSATFKIGDLDYFTVALIGNGLRIAAKWQDSEKKPILSNYLINKKFKDV